MFSIDVGKKKKERRRIGMKLITEIIDVESLKFIKEDCEGGCKGTKQFKIEGPVS